jgi:hypothetical protein
MLNTVCYGIFIMLIELREREKYASDGEWRKSFIGLNFYDFIVTGRFQSED